MAEHDIQKLYAWPGAPKPEAPPAKPVYTLENPRPVTVIRSEPEVSCDIGVIFCWDNGAGLANTSCQISLGNGEILDAALNEQSFISQPIPSDRHTVQLQAWFDPKSSLAESRTELQTVLDEVIVVERQEAADLQKIQDQRNVAQNLFYAQLALGKGFLLGAWGLVKTLDEFSDLVDPYTLYSNAAVAAWNAQTTRDKTWVDSFRDNFSAEQHRELVEALGFDPSSITREKLAEAYEMACFIFEDESSKRMLAKFAKDYAQAQNHEEVIEFSGGVAFEIILAALLIALTGGTGLAARGSAATAKLLPLLKRLGETVHTLGRRLRNAKLHPKGRAEGRGSMAQTVEIARPKEVRPAQLYRPDRKLPRNKHGVHEPDADIPHSQLGNKKGRNGDYRQVREWQYDDKGNLAPNRDIDFTDHGRPSDHTNPHQHDWVPNSTGGSLEHGNARPLEYPD